MKGKLSWLIAITGILGWAFYLAQTGKPFWIAISLLLFFGVVLLDKSEVLLSDEINLGIYTGVAALVLWAFCEKSAEDFWRAASGAIFLLAVLYEYNFGIFNRGSFLRSAFIPALSFFLFSQCQGLRFLEPEQALTCDLIALLSLTFFEIPIFSQRRAQAIAFSPISSVRLGLSGLFSIYYLTNFVPSIVHQDPFRNLFLLFPLIAVIISGVSLLVRDAKARFVFFAANLSLLISWASLIGEEAQLTGAILATLGASLGALTGAMAVPKEYSGKQLLLKITPWAFPGTVLFTFLVLIFYPTTQILVSEGAALWAVSILISWIGGVSFSDEKSDEENSAPPTVRVRIAIALSALGGPLLPVVPHLVGWLSKSMAVAI